MKNPLLLFLLFLCGATAAQGQMQTLKGLVIDKQSEYPLIGASVVIPGTDPLLGATTDAEGFFRIDNVPVGRYMLEVTYLGYDPVRLSNIVVRSAKETVLTIRMEESLVKVAEVVVQAGAKTKGQVANPLATVSARSLSVEEAGRYSGTFNDPARMAQNYAGVSGASDDRNDIIIRGNSPLGVLWRMEGIDIPNPSHFSALGATGGPVSMLNINNLSNSDFFTSAWSADYGNALSGVFDIRLRNGNRDKREYLGQIGFNGFELGAEGPFRKAGKASYIANYRYATVGVLKKIGLDFGLGDAVPDYQDLNFKFNFPTSRAGIFSVWGIGGLSDIHIAPRTEGDNSELFAEDATDILFGSNTGITGLTHTYFFDKNTYTRLMLVASGTETTGQIDSVRANGTQTDFFNFRHGQYKLSAHAKLNKKLSARRSITAGIMADRIGLSIHDTARVKEEYKEIKAYDGTTWLWQLYVNWRFRPLDRVSIVAGVHDQFYTLNRTNSLEPRLGLRYRLSTASDLSLGLGLHSQMQPAVTYFAQDSSGVETNRDLDFSKAVHAVVGYTHRLGTDVHLKTELYYQYLYNIPVEAKASSFSMLNGGADFTIPDVPNLVNNGTGENYGVEFSIEKFFSKGYYYLVTASVFDSKYTGSDGVERNTRFNSNYVFNFLAGKEFKIRQHRLSIDTKVTYAGGRRYTPFDLVASAQAHEAVPDLDRIFEERYAPYFKWDLKFSFKQNLKHISQEWSVDLTNLTNHKNVFQKGYSVRRNKETTTYQRGFFPNIQYKIYF